MLKIVLVFTYLLTYALYERTSTFGKADPNANDVDGLLDSGLDEFAERQDGVMVRIVSIKRQSHPWTKSQFMHAAIVN